MNSSAFRVCLVFFSLYFLLGVYSDGSSGLGEKQTRANWLFGIQNKPIYINGHSRAQKKERHLDSSGGAHKYLQRITSAFE
jgi:outer membrane protein TolC